MQYNAVMRRLYYDKCDGVNCDDNIKTQTLYLDSYMRTTIEILSTTAPF